MLLAVLLAPLFTPVNLSSIGVLQSLILGAVISVTGFLGDIVMSAIKRDKGIKDTSTLLPGHSGLLDRIDPLIYTAPFFVLLMSLFFNNPS